MYRDYQAGPLTTVNTTDVGVYETAKCSSALIGTVVFEKAAEIFLAVRTVKDCPMAGTKLLSNGWFR